MLVIYSRLGTESDGEDRPKQVSTQVSTLGTKKILFSCHIVSIEAQSIAKD